MRFVQLEEKLKKEFFPVLLVEGDDAFCVKRQSKPFAHP